MPTKGIGFSVEFCHSACKFFSFTLYLWWVTSEEGVPNATVYTSLALSTVVSLHMCTLHVLFISRGYHALRDLPPLSLILGFWTAIEVSPCLPYASLFFHKSFMIFFHYSFSRREPVQHNTLRTFFLILTVRGWSSLISAILSYLCISYLRIRSELIPHIT